MPERGLVPHIRAAQGAKHQIAAMWVQGQRLVVAGGIFPEATDAVRGDRNVFVFDGERFAPLAGGAGAISIDSLAATPDALYFGGFVATAGGGDAAVASIGSARFALGASPVSVAFSRRRILALALESGFLKRSGGSG